jgi:uncharacterized protein (TIGR04562 family)
MTKADSRVPVIANADEFSIPWQTLQTIIAGRSLIDTPELQVANLDEARRFLQAYGLEDSDDPERLRSIALDYIETVLLADSELCLPQALRELSLAQLLVTASTLPRTVICEWSCVILKVCHAVAHALWTRGEDAYRGALALVQARLEPYLSDSSLGDASPSDSNPDDSSNGTWIGDDRCRIPVVEYRIKTEKHFYRLVTKLLLKEGNLSSEIYDHIGMRFVTHDIFSAILLIKFLRRRHVFMYANVLPQESKNSLAEFDQIEALFAEFSEPADSAVKASGEQPWPAAKNHYSSKKFKMIKIIERVLVTTGSERKVFFPCELQILTRQTQDSLNHKNTLHSAYEKRQVKGVRRRLFRGTSLFKSG